MLLYMTEYLKVDEQGFNGYFNGIPKGDITIIKGNLDDMVLLWSKSLSTDNMAIYSNFRSNRILEDNYETVIGDFDDIDEYIEGMDMIVLELNSIENHNKIYNKIVDESTAVLVICEKPEDRLRADASVVFEEKTKVRNMVEIDSKFIVKKHKYLSLQDRDRVYDVSYRPEPFVDDDIQH